MTPPLPYLLGILLVVFIIDFTLRALPFKILEPLRESSYVRNMAVWMPPGILLILVLATLNENVSAAGAQWWAAIIATAVTILVHLATKRRLLWSVGLGTLSYILMLNWL